MSNVISVEVARRTSSAKKIRACAAWNRDIAELIHKATYKDSASEQAAFKNAERLVNQADKLDAVASQM